MPQKLSLRHRSVQENAEQKRATVTTYPELSEPYSRRASLVQRWIVRHGGKRIRAAESGVWVEHEEPVLTVEKKQCPECGSARIFEQISITVEGCIDHLSCVWICDTCKASGPVDIMGNEGDQ